MADRERRTDAEHAAHRRAGPVSQYKRGERERPAMLYGFWKIVAAALDERPMTEDELRTIIESPLRLKTLPGSLAAMAAAGLIRGEGDVWSLTPKAQKQLGAADDR